ncbi:alpha/beta hydrolase [Granulosicoccus antarcticus]|nr:alpha/beta hydrolase [Granulosicoccus antarcticus]
MNAKIQTYRWNPPPDTIVRPHGIYLLHGTGEHACRYEGLVTRLTSRGWRVGAHDHIGHGRSQGQRGLVYPENVLSTTATVQIEAFANETGATPVLFGHSLGGVLATQLVIEEKLAVSGLILSAPAYAAVMRPIDRIKLRLLSTFAPKLCLDLGYDPSRLTKDVAVQQAAVADPLIHGYKSATLVNWLLDTGQRMIDKAAQLDVDTLLMIAGADTVADSSKTRLFASKVPAGLLTVHDYEGDFHELLNETLERRERTLTDIEQWLERF